MEILGIGISFRIFIWNQVFLKKYEFYCSISIFIVFATDETA